LVKSQLRFAFITFLFLILTYSVSFAQRRLGIRWKVPENQEQAVRQLQQFHQMGISLIKISENPAPKVWKAINNLEIQVYADIGIHFPVTKTFASADSSLIHLIESKASAYFAHPSVKAIGLFEDGSIKQEKFQSAIKPFIEQLQNAGKRDIYFVSSRSLNSNSIPTSFYLYKANIYPRGKNTMDIPTDKKIGGYLFTPSPSLKGYLSPFKQFLANTASVKSKPIFISEDWLLSAIEAHPQFKSTIKSLSSEAKAIFPVPNESLPEQKQPVIPVIILFIVWGVAALHYNSSPLYRKSLFRYFGAHKFFIDDIFHRQIRSSSPALLIILQNIFLNSASVFATFLTLWSPTGRDALFYHLPILKIFDSSPLSILILSISLSTILSLISVLWLYIGHRKSNSLTQVATIYAWPLQLNFVTGTIAIASFSAGGGSTVVTIFSCLTLFIFSMSFIFTSIDIARFKAKRPILYVLGTTGIYLISIGLLCTWLMTFDSWFEIIRLSLQLT